MKKSMAILISALLVFTLIPAVLPADISVSASTVSEIFDGYKGVAVSTKGNFENITAEALAGVGWGLPEGSLVTGAEDAHSGSAYITVPAGSSMNFTAKNMTKAGYMLRGYYKHLSDGTTAGSQIFMEQVGVHSSNYNSALVYSTGWTRFGMMLNASQMGDAANIRFTINNGAGCATLCFDDLELIRLDNYDRKNLVQNPGFDVNDIDTATQAQHHYASWFNNGSGRLVSDAHTGGKALNTTGGNFYTWAYLPTADTEGKKYEFSAWVKWSYGAAFAAGQSGIVAPSIGLESYEGNSVVYAKDYAFTKETGITGSDWCQVKFILDAESTPVGITNFRLFLKPGTGGTVWDDICIRPVDTGIDFMDETGTKTVYSVASGEEASYTARVQYVGAEGAADGKLLMAAYNYDEQGDLILAGAGYARAKADGTTTLCSMSNVVASDDDITIIKAWLWDANHAPVTMAEIKSRIKNNPISTESFENITGTQPENTIEWVGASITTEEAYTGEKSLKLSGYNARAIFEIPNLLTGNEYTLSFWYKGTVESGSGLVVRRQQWTNDGDAPIYTKTYDSSGRYGEDDWTLYTYTFVQQEGTVTKIGPFLYYGSGTVYIDNIALTPTENAAASRIVTDQVFYYSDLTGNGTATVKLDPRLADRNCTANIRLMDGEDILKEETGVEFTDNEATFVFDLSLLSELRKEYRVEAEIIDGNGRINYGSSMQQVYKFDRPSTISKDGTFTDINGKKIEPMFMYHIGYDDFATAASAGINVMQYSAPSDVNECLRQLDEMYEMGVYAAVVCYWGMSPAGSAGNHDRVRDYIEQIKHHPAIFCYMVMDEPFLNNSNAYEDLRKSYIMLRTADPARPTYICEGFPPYMKEVAKYCDIMAPDIYPGYTHGSLSTLVGEQIQLAHKYVNYDKPLITILQAFTQNGVKPTATELHSMMYQSLMGGGNAVGFYTWEPDNPAIDNKICDDFYWPMMQAFYEDEKAVVYDYYAYGKGTLFNRNVDDDGDIWYESWYDESGDTLYMVVQNRDEDQAVTSTVPLISNDGQVTIDGTIDAVGYEADSVSITKKTGEFDISLGACQAVLIKISLQ